MQWPQWSIQPNACPREVILYWKSALACEGSYQGHALDCTKADW